MDDIAEDFEEMASRQGGSRRGGGRGKGGRGDRSGGRGGGGASREVTVSRTMSRLLRHQATNAGIQLDKEGFAPLDRVLQWGPLRSLKPTFAEVQALVRDSDKQRFAIKPIPGKDGDDGDESSTDPSDWLIRANQGHSIKVVESDALLRPIALPDATGALPDGAAPVPPTVVHGTYFTFWPSIVDSGGLKPGSRNHVHCSTGLPGDGLGDDGKEAVVSGMRYDAELLIFVDVEACIRETGMKWWLSDNGVVLTAGDDAGGAVPLRFFREVVGRREGVGVLWKDGAKVADLPPGLKGRVPRGKRGAGGGRGRGRGGG